MESLLAVDMGNSRTSFALYREGTPERIWHLPTETIDSTLPEHEALSGPKDSAPLVAVSSVVPAMRARLIESLSRKSLPSIVISVSKQKLLRNAYSTMGTDRLANAVAACHLHMKDAEAVIVIDFGTATTLTAVGRDRSLLGGLITIGLKTTLRSLHYDLGQLPELSIDEQCDSRSLELTPLATTTDAAILNGTLIAQSSTVDRWIELCRERIEGLSRVVITGGLAPYMKPLLAGVDRMDEDLTLTGIRLLAEEATDRADRA